MEKLHLEVIIMHAINGKMVVIKAKQSIIQCQILYCILLFIFVVLYLFQYNRSILEGYGRKELKRVRNRRNWQNSTKHEKIRAIQSTGLPEPIDRIFQRLSAAALVPGAAALAIGKAHQIFLFLLGRLWETCQNVFYSSWIYKDEQNSHLTCRNSQN